ncbi:MAG: RidA family protein [Hyphomicrobiales bacterium]|nr:RidA family protein [Hyphomicrobiales bacterium]
MAKRVLNPPSFKVRGSYSPAWEVSSGRVIYVAGQVPWDAEGRTVCKGDVAGQTRQVFENIRTILAEAGATLDDVVKITIFAADIRYRDAINKVRSETFKPPYPASTQVAVAALVDPEWLVEIEAVAFVEAARP